jgi:glycosyltransferase involved in cell wall biosynthesis
MSHLLFDARPLVEQTGGIPRVAARFLAYIRQTRLEDDVTLVTTGAHEPGGQAVRRSGGRLIGEHIDHPTTRPPDVQAIHIKLPNKLWSLACLLGLASLDRIATRKTGKTFDELILPNVGFVGTPSVPYTIVVHDLSFLIEPAWFSWKMQLWHRAVRAKGLIRNATHVWCVSETTARDVKQLLGVKQERISVLPPEVVVGPLDRLTTRPTDAPTPRRTDHPAPYILAFDGSARKNIGTAIAAVERLREDEQFHDLQLIVIGRSRIDAQRTWVSQRTNVSDTERDDLYRNASALLYPSWYEGFGLPLHEAAAFHIPILASNHGALPETAPPGTTLINPAKPQLWASALKNILTR